MKSIRYKCKNGRCDIENLEDCCYTCPNRYECDIDELDSNCDCSHDLLLGCPYVPDEMCGDLEIIEGDHNNIETYIEE